MISDDNYDNDIDEGESEGEAQNEVLELLSILFPYAC